MPATEKILLDAGSSGENGWSTRSDILKCPHRYALKVEGFEGDDRAPLLRGSTFHVGIAHYYAQIQYAQLGRDVNLLYTPDAAIVEYARRNPACAPYVQISLDAMDAYECEHACDSPKVFAVEHRVTMTVKGPTTGKEYPHTMRIDLMTTDASGRIWAWDHKTAARIDNRKRPGFELSGQILGIQWWGMQAYGERWGGMVVNMIEWKAGGANFLRFQPRIAPFAISQFPRTIEYTAELRAFCEERYGENADDWPMAISEQGPCMDRYGPCEFRSMCRWGTGILGRDV